MISTFGRNDNLLLKRTTSKPWSTSDAADKSAGKQIWKAPQFGERHGHRSSDARMREDSMRPNMRLYHHCGIPVPAHIRVSSFFTLTLNKPDSFSYVIVCMGIIVLGISIA